MAWFSTRLRFVLLVETEGATMYSDSVYIFQVNNDGDNTDLWSEALRYALRLGSQHEEEYLNAENHRVSLRLKEVATLDMIQASSLDGAEVYSEFAPLGDGEEIPFDTQFDPGNSCPTQTGI